MLLKGYSYELRDVFTIRAFTFKQVLAFIFRSKNPCFNSIRIIQCNVTFFSLLII